VGEWSIDGDTGLEVGDRPDERFSNAAPTDQALQADGMGKLDDDSAESVNKHLESCSGRNSRQAARTRRCVHLLSDRNLTTESTEDTESEETNVEENHDYAFLNLEFFSVQVRDFRGSMFSIRTMA
jgi:hypothetical protein